MLAYNRFAPCSSGDWIYSDGQHFASEEGYSELPAPLLEAIRKRVQEIR